MGVKPIGVKDNFFELGGHSLMAVRLFAYIEKEFERSIPLTTLFQTPTVEDLAEKLREEEQPEPSNSLVAIQPSGNKPPLFCVPGHVANTIQFLDLSRYLGSDQPFYAMQIPNLDSSEPLPFIGIEDMAAHFIKEIRALQGEGPYYIGGFCFGGRVAFEIARQLHEQGQQIVFLALKSTYAPGDPKPSLRYGSYSFRVIRSFQKAVGLLGIALRLELGERLNHIIFEAKKNFQLFKHYIKQDIKKILAKFSIHIGHPMSREWRRIQEANRAAENRYSPQPFPGEVILFRGSKELFGTYFNPTFGWEDFTDGMVDVIEYPSYVDIDWILHRPRLRTLAKLLKDSLDRVQAQEGVKRQ
jgi:thioesterase domain-containing protein/acyl carrier protein